MVVGGHAWVRGQNMQIFLSLHGRTLTKAVPDSRIQGLLQALMPLSHYSCLCDKAPRGSLRVPLTVIKQNPVVHAISQFCC